MHARGGSENWVRLSLVVVAVIIAGTLAMPATALAKTVTRLVVAKTVTVANGDASATVWPRALTVKLQKRITSTHYHALSGTVKLYRYDVDDHIYRYVMSRRGSTVSFPIPGRGRYRFVYSGSSTMRSCTAYSTVFEDIGFDVAFSGISVTPASPTESWITLTYTADWNTAAWDGRVWFGSDMSFGTTESEALYYERWLKAPGAVEFTFKIDNADIEPVLYDSAIAYVDDDDDPYILDSEWIDNVNYLTS